VVKKERPIHVQVFKKERPVHLQVIKQERPASFQVYKEDKPMNLRFMQNQLPIRVNVLENHMPMTNVEMVSENLPGVVDVVQEEVITTPAFYETRPHYETLVHQDVIEEPVMIKQEPVLIKHKPVVSTRPVFHEQIFATRPVLKETEIVTTPVVKEVVKVRQPGYPYGPHFAPYGMFAKLFWNFQRWEIVKFEVCYI